MGFRLGSSPEYIRKVWPIGRAATPKIPVPEEASLDTPAIKRAQLKCFASARLRG